MSDCIFCKIVAGDVPASIIWEDSDFVAFLDRNPLKKGQTLVIPKAHWDSYVFTLSDEQVTKLYLAAKKVAGLLDKSLNTSRTIQVMEGLGVKHAHLKLYPLGKGENEGGLVHMGATVSSDELDLIAEKIRKGGD